MKWLKTKARRFTWWLLNYPLVDFEDEPDTVVVLAFKQADVVWMGLVCRDAK